jgi:hypothetical protein
MPRFSEWSLRSGLAAILRCRYIKRIVFLDFIHRLVSQEQTKLGKFILVFGPPPLRVVGCELLCRYLATWVFAGF